MSEPVVKEGNELTPTEIEFELLDSQLVPIPLEAINRLTLVALYDADMPDVQSNVINSRTDIVLIDSATVQGGLPAGLRFTYAVGTDGRLKGTLWLRALDMPINDSRLPYEEHRALFECLTTESEDPVPLEVVIKVRNIRRVGTD